MELTEEKNSEFTLAHACGREPYFSPSIYLFPDSV